MCAFVYKWNCSSEGSFRARSISVLGVCTAECVPELQAERGGARGGARERGREGGTGGLCVCFSQSRHCCVLLDGGGRPRALTKGVFVIWKKTQRAAAINVRPEVYYAITPQSHS